MISGRFLLIMAQTWLVLGAVSLVYASVRLFMRALDVGMAVSHLYWIIPVAILLAGPLADDVFEPMLAEGGVLADSVGRIIGTGPGRGIGLIHIIAGAGIVLLAVAGWIAPRIRNIESELPDLAGRKEAADE